MKECEHGIPFEGYECVFCANKSTRINELFPKRIQRKRTKGWRMPAGAVYVGRPGKFGNPFDHLQFGRERATELHLRWLMGIIDISELVSMGFAVPGATGFRLIGIDKAEAARRELRGKDLVCWCGHDQPCHADNLLRVANTDDLLGIYYEFLPEGFHPMSTAPRDGTPIEILFRHYNYYYADEKDRHEWEQICDAYWTDFNRGGWVWHGIAGTAICWRPA